MDSVLITADARVVGHLNAHEDRARHGGGYLAFLREGLARARGEDVPEAPAAAPAPVPEPPGDRRLRQLTLVPKEPAGELLNVIQKRGLGQQSMLFLHLDATAFPGGGEIQVEITLGGGDAAGRFELCAPVPGPRPAVSPVRTLRGVAPGASQKMVYRFDEGAVFMLAAAPAADAAEGAVNAFRAKVRVVTGGR